MASIDAALAAQNAVLAAESLGLGTVYICALRNRPSGVSAELKLPRYAFPLFGLCIGHCDPSRPSAVKPRLSQPAIQHREHYSTQTENEVLAEYNEFMAAFQRSQAFGTAIRCKQNGLVGCARQTTPVIDASGQD